MLKSFNGKETDGKPAFYRKMYFAQKVMEWLGVHAEDMIITVILEEWTSNILLNIKEVFSVAIRSGNTMLEKAIGCINMTMLQHTCST